MPKYKPRARRRLLLLLMMMTMLPALVLPLAGCADLGRGGGGLAVGQSTIDDVQARYGRPVRSWRHADGGQTLEYSSQPFGMTCYMVTLDRQGKLLAIEDTLTETSRFTTITPGMTPEQVSRRLGTERSRVFFRLSGEEVWDWNVQPEQTGYRLRFNVHFKDGVVLRTTQSMVYPGRFPYGDF